MGTTTFRAVLAAMLFAAGMLGAQTSQNPQELTWAVAEFQGGGDWAVRLPLQMARGWEAISTHVLSDAESTALVRDAAEDAARSIDEQESRLKLALDLNGLDTLPNTEPLATQKAIADLEAKRASAPAEISKTMPTHAVWGSGKDSQPWAFAPRKTLLDRTKATFLFSGTVRTVGSYLRVQIELYSDVEKRVLSRWEGQFAPDEAPVFMAQAADQFRPFLLGREWAGIVVTGVSGARVEVEGVWHVLPWFSDELVPGSLNLTVQVPGGVPEVRSLVLETGLRRQENFEPAGVRNEITLQTVPTGAELYMDSRYLGLSPQIVERPLVISRVRAQSPGFATAAWEIGPQTISPSLKTLLPPSQPRSVPQEKDHFYLSLTAFSFSLTSSAFLGAWRDEQVKLVNAYSTAGAEAGYTKAYGQFQIAAAGYAAGIALTSAVFVWMMFELGDYLGAAQDSLP